MAINGLFPPIIDTYIGAYTIDNILNNLLIIPFNISEFNTLTDIKSVHISITRQSNYGSLFNPTVYPMGIYIINTDTSGAISFNGNNGDLIISPNVLNGKEFTYNEYFKVQLRFSTEKYTGGGGQALTTYLTNESNLEKFSEWSTVGLFRMIAPNRIDISLNGILMPSASSIASSNITLVGKFKKTNPTDINHILPSNSSVLNSKNDTESLTAYRIVLENSSSEQLLDSGYIQIPKVNNAEINYKIPYFFESGNNYNLKLYWLTENLYNGINIVSNISVRYDSQSWSDQHIVDQSIAIDSVIGKVNIAFSPAEGQASIPARSKLVIRRGSDIDNFQYWDTIWSKTLTTNTSNIISFNDFTIESGVLYKYEINYINTSNVVYNIVSGPIISVFDNAFLTGQGTQLCVKFNPNLTNFKRNVSDNIITTLGGKHPYINRNGDMNYRSFNLTGTIAYEMDAEHQFATRSSIYGENIEIYGSYFVNRYINQQNDRITQRKFRELVMDYLYNETPKLFRSTPEGNILVRLTDITFTPNQQLGRMIYDFSCVATEIGDATVDNYKLYEIQDFGDA